MLFRHDLVNVNLKNKPDWFQARTPVGAVPVLELADGRILYESLIVCEYLDNAYPEHRLTPADPFVKAQHQILVEMFSRVIGPFYKLLRSKEASAAEEISQGLDYFEKALNTKFFGGKFSYL
jgi:glutathione S-transferase